MDKKRKLLLIFAELVLLVGLIVIISGHFTSVINDPGKQANVIQTDERATNDEPLVTLFMASDYQEKTGWRDPQKTLRSVFQAARDDGKSIDRLIMCGDYSNEPLLYDHQVSPEKSIKRIKKFFINSVTNASDDDILFVQGNHDALSGSISDSGLHEYKDYYVYVLNTQNDFPWSQGKKSGSLSKVRSAAKHLEKSLNVLAEKGEVRPVIIAGHVPLHYTARVSSKHNTGDNLYSSIIFNAVNKASENHDIVYVFGHNHSKGWDCYLGGSCIFKGPGDSLLLPDFDEDMTCTDNFREKELKFTYLNAGYVGYYMNCADDEIVRGNLDKYQISDVTLTGTVCEIYPDRIELTRYSEDGKHCLGSDGCCDPYKNNIDIGLVPEKYYSKTVGSPVIIERRMK